MSAEVRAEIAAAATTVEGVECAASGRPSAAVGAGHVRRGTTTEDAFGAVVVWEVVVVLPSDVATAEVEQDRLVPLLRHALAGPLTVQSVEPVDLRFESTTKPALLLRGTREED